MKKVISLFTVIAMLISLIAALPIYAEDDVLFSENFDKYVFDMPNGWTANAFAQKKAWLQKDYAESGNAMHVYDDSKNDAVVIYGPPFEVVPNEAYTAVSQVFSQTGTVGFYIKFFDATGKEIASTANAVSANGSFNTVTTSAFAPANAVTAKVTIATGIANIGIGYYDDINVYKGIVKATTPLNIIPPEQKESVNAKIIEPVGDKLVYNTYNEYNDKLGDFSYSGFYNGEYELPDSSKLPVAAVVEPSENPEEDDTERLQKIIDDVYNNSPDNRFKVVKLKAGRYNISKQGLYLRSGIVLSGEGQGPDGTIIYASDAASYSVVFAAGKSPVKVSNDAYITDDYVESGSYTITIEEERIKDYSVGDLINIHHHCTEEWCKEMKMQGVLNYADEYTYWHDGDFNMDMERTITAIDGNTLTLDMPFYIPMQMTASKPYIYKIDESGRLEHVGVENLRLESYYNGTPDDENHAATAVWYSNVKNSYVRDVSAKYFAMSAVTMANGARQVTVKNCSSLDPVSQVAGGRRYSFRAIGSQQLFSGCYSYSGRHDYTTTSSSTGPIVYTDSVVDESNQATENHGFWATGTLYDNILSVSNNHNSYMAFTNRGYWGIGQSHGWSAAGTVAWNCLFSAIVGSKPPMTYDNFMVGQWGYYSDAFAKAKRDSNIEYTRSIYRTSEILDAGKEYYHNPEGSSFGGDCYMEAVDTSVEPRSIYKAQLAERITGSFKNAKPNAPVITKPRGEDGFMTNSIEFEGLYQMGAEKVTLYIDNKPYEAKLDEKTNMFSLNLTLSDGVHKIYATQTINGVESTKCADRFITIKKSLGNFDYLQSDYEFDKIHPLINSEVISFDEYQKEYYSDEVNEVTVLVNNVKLKSDVKPTIMNGRIMVPVRAIFESLNAEVSYDENTKTATGKRDDLVITISDNSKTAYVGGEAKELDMPATIVDGRFLAPVRFVAESLGADVNWQDLRRTAIIEGGILQYPPIHNLPGELGVYRAIQSADDGAGNSIEKLFDGTNSNWAVSADNKNGSYGIFDFGSVKDFKDVHIEFYSGTARIYTFDILVSDNGTDYTMVAEKIKSSGTTEEMEVFPINARGRYIKIVGHGSNINAWNNYREVAFTAK